jgi:hypothetical protein
MRFMILVRATPDSEAGKKPDEEMLAAMAAYHEEMARAGVLVDGNGLHPSARGFRISSKGGRQVVTDGPFTESKELIAGYTIINVRSRAEALEWAKRMPCPHLAEGEIEVRQMYELEELGDSAVLDRFRDIGMGVGKKG